MISSRTICQFICFLVLFSFQNPPAWAQCPSCSPPTIPNCKVDRETTFWVKGCVASATAPWEGFGGPSRTGMCIATVPPAWMLVDWRIDFDYDNNGSYNITKVASGTEFEYKKIIDEAYETATDLSAKIADGKKKKEAEAKISSDYKNHLELFERLKTNKDTVRVEVSATPHGSPVDRKRGWKEVGVSLLVQCVAPLDLNDQLKSKYQLLKDAEGRLNSVMFKNSTASELFVAWRPADRFTSCSDTKSAISLMRISSGAEGEAYIDQALQVCYASIDSIGATPKFRDKCREGFGATVDANAKALECR